MKKIYETIFNCGEADRFGGQLTKICFVLIFYARRKVLLLPNSLQV